MSCTVPVRAVLALVCALTACGRSDERHVPGAPTATPTAPTTPPPPAAPVGLDPRLIVAVDRRVELLSIVSRLAGYPEYGKPARTAYARAVDAHFATWREHPAVLAARALRDRQHISFNAPIGLAVYLDDHLALRRPLSPLPAGLDARWAGADVDGYVAALQDFARVSDLDGFLAGQAPFTAAVEGRVRAALEGARVVDWFDDLFDPRPTTTFRVVPGLLSGDMAYAAQAVAAEPGGAAEMMQVLYLPPPGADGLPRLSPDTVYLLVHEFAHGYVNPVLDARRDVVLPAAAPVHATVAAIMARQHYPDAAIMTNESVVRALVVLYARDRGPAGAGATQLADEVRRGFAWTGALADALARLRDAEGGQLPPDALAATTRDVFAAWPR